MALGYATVTMHSNHKFPVIIVIQARVSSKRLPAKVLLPINQIPLAILAIKRAANTGLPVRLATSLDRSDDLLVKYARLYGIEIKKNHFYS